jgi:hypothetical protein
MKTTKVKFEFNVPNWLYRYNWKNLKNYFSYQLNPYRCMDCGVKMPHKHGDVELYDIVSPMKARLSVGYMTLDGSLCPHCLIKRIDKLANSPEFLDLQQDDIYNIQQKCDVCEEEKMALKAIKMSKKPIDNVRFCTHGSWNGHHVCLDCAKTALLNGVTKSGIFSYYKGKYTSMNQHNLPVVDGKARFPDQ